jgi:hypothetical protein
LRLRELSTRSRFLGIHNSRDMTIGKHWHLWDFIKVEKAPIDERIMNKSLKNRGTRFTYLVVI